MRRHLVRSLWLLAVALPPFLPQSGFAKTWVVPHVFDTAGGVSGTTNTFDLFFYFSYNGGLPGVTPAAPGGATVDLYLFDDSGQPAQTANANNVCFPCSFPMDSSTRHADFRVEDAFDADGGLPGSVYIGYAVIVASGDAEAVGIQSFLANSHSGPADLSTLSFMPEEIDTTPITTLTKTMVFPHLLETSGSGGYTFDSYIYFLYTGGQPGGPPPGPVGAAQVDVYLFDPTTGMPSKSLTNNDVCNPCTEIINTTSPKADISLEDKFVAAGGFPSPAPRVCAVATMTSDAPVAVQGIGVNTHSGPADVDLFLLLGTDVPTGTSSTAAPGNITIPDPVLQATPNPFNPSTRLTYKVAEPGRVRLDIIDAAGRLVATVVDEHRESGVFEVEWNGMNRAGRLVSSGVYFAHMTTADGAEVTKLVMVK